MNQESSLILIVDDEEVARDILQGFLYRGGYRLAFASNGQEALTFVEQSPPDAILLDVMMPDIDGFEVCQRLKANKRWRHIPIILITALGGREELIRGLEAGADDFLFKPINDLELRARVRSLLRIKKQYDELQANLEMREDLAHMMVHDMRTPLGAILGYSELLLLQQSLMPEYADSIAKIHGQAQRLNSFINDMLMVAKMEADELILNPSEVDVSELVRKVKGSHEVMAASKRITLSLDLPPESRQISLDKNLFERLLDNLISNGLKYSPPGSKVKVKLEHPATGKPQLRLQVFDQGEGIREEDRSRIFDKYKVATLKEQGVQVGLGLAFCKMVVDAHQGHIFVADNQPNGSIFTVEI